MRETGRLKLFLLLFLLLFLILTPFTAFPVVRPSDHPPVRPFSTLCVHRKEMSSSERGRRTHASIQSRARRQAKAAELQGFKTLDKADGNSRRRPIPSLSLSSLTFFLLLLFT